jgi:hypothetical protein
MLNNSSRLLKDAMTKKIQTYNSASRRCEKAVKRRNLEFPWRARNKGPIFSSIIGCGPLCSVSSEATVVAAI